MTELRERLADVRHALRYANTQVERDEGLQALAGIERVLEMLAEIVRAVATDE